MRGNVTRKVRGALRGTVAVVSAVSAALLVTSCDDGGDAKSGAGQGAAAVRPSPSPTPTSAWDPRPRSIASLGDSITRGFDACSVLKDCPEASWATGTKVDSLARRLLPSPATSSWNFAKTGARMADLPDQMRAAVQQKPQLVTVLVGANDACRNQVSYMTPVDDFRADFESSVAELRKALPKSQLYVASVPDLKRLWTSGRNNSIAKTVWKLGICPTMLRDPDAQDPASEERRAQVDKRVGEYNAVLKDVCGRDKLCRYDGSVHGYDFDGDQLSKWDWFHPSKNGQGRLADMAYREITAVRPSGT
ncbi:SGNH/GDSL hydrolase family protein [Streptomyces albireticuli]|uniref:Uncharacterized protein n=1 Tax=Streptomyces albireticuli TaxID=1940 RepID=A0A2A2DGM8_9ACTN|nr:SGNH/GDSL hydrolase family protein [Streptomyces albireticuli]MCD9141896.1 SGNH/GDSL hydrolase family protein [Streptomyces albireticuli]MCD9163160.1 SGNH/GDSL hydrolase family protein [Streptomyces albireticuli]MCD9190070.1 SGNH/GDSL hydrolase family protein [Streptomyces albireticuli]PAU50470.1 hypothetical protein CK936_02430 [Streptomyces albireticuli]